MGWCGSSSPALTVLHEIHVQACTHLGTPIYGVLRRDRNFHPTAAEKWDPPPALLPPFGRRVESLRPTVPHVPSGEVHRRLTFVTITLAIVRLSHSTWCRGKKFRPRQSSVSSEVWEGLFRTAPPGSATASSLSFRLLRVWPRPYSFLCCSQIQEKLVARRSVMASQLQSLSKVKARWPKSSYSSCLHPTQASPTFLATASTFPSSPAPKALSATLAKTFLFKASPSSPN